MGRPSPLPMNNPWPAPTLRWGRDTHRTDLAVALTLLFLFFLTTPQVIAPVHVEHLGKPQTKLVHLGNYIMNPLQHPTPRLSSSVPVPRQWATSAQPRPRSTRPTAPSDPWLW
jgi:hypothetical protein